MRVQQGTKNLPILLQPRINAVVVTVSQIKASYSNHFQNDIDTPMTFYAEYRDRIGNVQTLLYNAGESSDGILVFDPPAGFWDAEIKYSLLFFWLVTDSHTGLPLEKIYTEDPVVLEVINQHNEI